MIDYPILLTLRLHLMETSPKLEDKAKNKHHFMKFHVV
jgi:hypothetical protein